MNETFLSYINGDSVLHRVDARIKLLGLAAFAVCAMSAHPYGLIVVSVFAAVAFRASRLRLFHTLRSSRGMLYLFALIVLASCIADGNVISGLRSGALYSARLAATVLIAHVFISTTTVSAIRSSVARILKPLPFVHSGVISTMIGASISFIAIPMRRASLLGDAVRARGMNPRRRTIRYTKLLFFSLTIQSLKEVDDRASALEARGYALKTGATRKRLSRLDRYAFLVIFFTATLAATAGLAVRS